MKKSTEIFLQANRRNLQNKMKKFEYCPSDMKAGQAIREIKEDLLNKLIHFQKKKGIYIELIGLEMVEFETVAGEKYWRAVPTWGIYSNSRLENCKRVAAGEYMPAGGEKTKKEMIRVANLPIIECE